MEVDAPLDPLPDLTEAEVSALAARRIRRPRQLIVDRETQLPPFHPGRLDPRVHCMVEGTELADARKPPSAIQLLHSSAFNVHHTSTSLPHRSNVSPKLLALFTRNLVVAPRLQESDNAMFVVPEPPRGRRSARRSQPTAQGSEQLQELDLSVVPHQETSVQQPMDISIAAPPMVEVSVPAPPIEVSVPAPPMEVSDLLPPIEQEMALAPEEYEKENVPPAGAVESSPNALRARLQRDKRPARDAVKSTKRIKSHAEGKDAYATSRHTTAVGDEEPSIAMEVDTTAQRRQSSVATLLAAAGLESEPSTNSQNGSPDRTQVSLGDSSDSSESTLFMRRHWGPQSVVMKVICALKEDPGAKLTVAKLLQGGPIPPGPGRRAMVVAYCFGSLLHLKKAGFVKILKKDGTSEIDSIFMGVRLVDID